MTGRNRARKCTIYLRMYIVPTCHSAYHYTANGVVTTRVPRCVCIRASRPMLFSIPRPSRAPPQDPSTAFFPGTFFPDTFPGRADCVPLYARALASTHRATRSPRAPPPAEMCPYTRTWYRCMCTEYRRPRENKVRAKNDRALSLLLFVDPTYITMPH